MQVKARLKRDKRKIDVSIFGFPITKNRLNYFNNDRMNIILPLAFFLFFQWRKMDRERGFLSVLTVNMNSPPMQIHDTFDERQAKTQTCLALGA